MSPARSSSTVAAILLVASAAAAAGERVSVVFVDPERFTDVKDAAMSSDRGTRAILDDLARFVRERGERELPPGLTLEVRVTDVDLAGEFEPWRGPQFERVRFMREIHWPRIDLEFRVKDAEGRVVRDGKRSLADPNYLTRSLRVSDDRLRYEKDLLAEWLRQELGR
jgi:Protein of unknown function (DUF3016)